MFHPELEELHSMWNVLYVGEKQKRGAFFHKALELKDQVMVIDESTAKDEIRSALLHVRLVILHVGLGKRTARFLIRSIREQDSQVRILVAGLREQEEVLDYIETGAFGYILEKDSPKVIRQKIRAALQGEVILSPEVAAHIVRRISQLAQQHRWNSLPAARLHKMGELSRRETEVLALISQGYSNEEIARKLVIERGTVKNHVHRILRKLGVSNRNQATRIYRDVMATKHAQVYA